VAIARAQGDEDDYAWTVDPLDWRSRQETDAILALARRWQRRPCGRRRAPTRVRRMIRAQAGGLEWERPGRRATRERAEVGDSDPAELRAMWDGPAGETPRARRKRANTRVGS